MFIMNIISISVELCCIHHRLDLMVGSHKSGSLQDLKQLGGNTRRML
jgi:hypothetical protein